MHDPIEAWKAMTNTERREVLERLARIERSSSDGNPWLRAYEALQAIIDTPTVAV